MHQPSASGVHSLEEENVRGDVCVRLEDSLRQPDHGVQVEPPEEPLLDLAATPVPNRNPFGSTTPHRPPGRFSSP